MSKKENISFDFSQLEPLDKLDEEELLLHSALREREMVIHTDDETKKKYAKIFKEANHKRKALSLRMPENDYINIKAKALAFGVPYQSLINSIIHRYLTGELHG